jgi:hypothetical protein
MTSTQTSNQSPKQDTWAESWQDAYDALDAYMDGLERLKQGGEGIGCNMCYACVTGGSRPCLNIKKTTKKNSTRCKAITKKGTRCRRKRCDGTEYCYGHC